MKIIDDSKLYGYFALVMVVLALLLTFTGLYSRCYVESRVKTYLADETDVQRSFTAAYLMLRNPQVFAGYEHFDGEGISVRNTLSYFDSKMSKGEQFAPDDGVYLRLLLDRREKGSRLTLGTAVFCYLLSILAFGLYYQEKREISRI